MTGSQLLRALSLCTFLLLPACRDDREAPLPPNAPDLPSGAASPAPATAGARLRTLSESRFVPAGFPDSAALWGILRGRLAVVRLPAGSVESMRHTAWSVSTAPGVVSWRNELGLWGLRGEEGPRRLAPTELIPGYDGPPEALWSPDGRRAVLSWAAEWDFHHALLHPDGSRSALVTGAPGYMLDRAVLWLDGRRILFQIVATGPRGGQPEYRESGWRGDLAVLELHRMEGQAGDSTSFRPVTQVPDGSFLHVGGMLRGRLLVAEWQDGSVASSWLYETADWSRSPLALPRGRAWASGSTVVSYEPLPGGGGEARYHARLFTVAEAGGPPRQLLDLGTATDTDPPPALSSDGRLVALRLWQQGKPQLVLAEINR